MLPSPATNAIRRARPPKLRWWWLPRWRSQGLATELLRRLEEPALENGFDFFDAVYLPDNHAVARVFQNLAYSPARIEEGIATVSKKLAA